MENHIATAADFAAARELETSVERVILPKLQKPVLMRRPSPRWFIYRGSFPAVLAAEIAGQKSDGTRSVEDLQKYARWVCDLLAEVMVQPRVAQDPGPGEISPDLIADEDFTFIVRWALGAVASDGSDLSSFQRRDAADAGARG